MWKKYAIFCSYALCLILTACSVETQSEESEQLDIEESVDSGIIENPSVDVVDAEILVPSKEEVLAMRETVLEGMNVEEIKRLTENIKVANLRMESAYLNDGIFDKLNDPDNVYWQYFDKAGEFQLGWWYNRDIYDKEIIMRAEGISEKEFEERGYEPGIVYNRFDSNNFIELLEDMQTYVKNEKLRIDLQQLIDLSYIARITHEMEYANQIYKILHDLDYFLLRYGIEDMGKYTQDSSFVAQYYGVLNVYGATPFLLNEENSYNILHSETVENDPEVYGNVETIHEEFYRSDASLCFYYDIESFYFDDSFPVVLNKTLQDYYNTMKDDYLKNSEVYSNGSAEDYPEVPYNRLKLLYFTYVGEDYISMVFNDISYMGGAHPYSNLDGITIDCNTGEVVSVEQFLNNTNKEIGKNLKKVLGMDVYDADEWDYYITETSVVFFYYDPRYWESVATRKIR